MDRSEPGCQLVNYLLQLEAILPNGLLLVLTKKSFVAIPLKISAYFIRGRGKQGCWHLKVEKWNSARRCIIVSPKFGHQAFFSGRSRLRNSDTPHILIETYGHRHSNKTPTYIWSYTCDHTIRSVSSTFDVRNCEAPWWVGSVECIGGAQEVRLCYARRDKRANIKMSVFLLAAATNAYRNTGIALLVGVNVLSGSTWKGTKLRIGDAKPDYVER